MPNQPTEYRSPIPDSQADGSAGTTSFPAEHDATEHEDVVREVSERARITLDQARELVARHGADDVGRLLNYARHLIEDPRRESGSGSDP